MTHIEYFGALASLGRCLISFLTSPSFPKYDVLSARSAFIVRRDDSHSDFSDDTRIPIFDSYKHIRCDSSSKNPPFQRSSRRCSYAIFTSSTQCPSRSVLVCDCITVLFYCFTCLMNVESKFKNREILKQIGTDMELNT